MEKRNKNNLTSYWDIEKKIFDKITETFFTENERELTITNDGGGKPYKIAVLENSGSYFEGTLRDSLEEHFREDYQAKNENSYPEIKDYFIKKIGKEAYGIDFFLDEHGDAGKDPGSLYIKYLARSTKDMMQIFGNNKISLKTIEEKIEKIVDNEIGAVKNKFVSGQGFTEKLN